MEISYLNFEQKSLENDFKVTGKCLFDPIDLKIEFYDMKENFLHSKKISEISIMLSFERQANNI